MKKRILMMISLLTMVGMFGCSGGNSNNENPVLLGLLAQQSQAGNANFRLVLDGGSSANTITSSSGQTLATQAQAYSQADVTRVSITITGNGINTPITQDLVKSGNSWLGTVASIPAGLDRAVVARAYNGSDGELYIGTAIGVTIEDQATADVFIRMQDSNYPDSHTDYAPIIDSFSISSNLLAPEETVRLSVTATPGYYNQTLSYQWATTGGTFDDATSTTPVWTAPAADGQETLTVTVANPNGVSATMSVIINVTTPGTAPAAGSLNGNITINSAPVLSLISVDSTRLDVSESTNLNIVATDAEVDPLTYLWSSDCPGTFSDSAIQNPVFTAPVDYPAYRKCVLNVVVKDGNGGVTSSALTINILPAVVVTPIDIPVDRVAPTILSFELQQTTIPAHYTNISLNMELSDETALIKNYNSPFGHPTVTLTSPSGATSLLYNCSYGNGTDLVSRYFAYFNFPANKEVGVWTFEVNAYDYAGNLLTIDSDGLEAQFGGVYRLTVE